MCLKATFSGTTIYHAVFRLGLDLKTSAFRKLIKSKLAIPGNDAIKLDENRIKGLHSQLEGRLRPVLRPDDFQTFNLTRAINYIKDIATSIDLA